MMDMRGAGLGLAMLLLIPGVWPAQAAAACRAIRFEAGHDTAVVNGRAPADGTVCYTLATGNGQAAKLKIVTGSNTIFSIDGLVDAQDEYSFRTERKTYEIDVGQLMRSNTAEAFALSVSVK